jgi:Sigma-70, region 4
VRTFADAFAGAPALGPPGRARLALMLGGRRATIECAPLGDIHDRRHRHRLRDAVVSATDDDGVLERLADAPLGDLVPGASLLADHEIGTHECHARLFNLLAGQRVSRWSTLLGLRVGEVRAWPQASDHTTAEIVGLAFERSLMGLASAGHDTAPAGAAVDLAILLDHEQNAPSQPLLDALAALSSDGQPAQVRQAATRLMRTVPHAARHGEVWAGILAAAGDPRDLEVFVLRTLRLTRRPTLEDVAERVGLSVERVRQLRVRAEGRIRAAAASAPDDSRALVAAVRDWLGSVVPVEVADDVARRLGAGSAHTRIGGLLLWLAGPYLPVSGRDGWLAVDPAGTVARTVEWLAEDGGVRPAQEISDELVVEGVRREHHDAWVAACGGVAVDDMVMHVVGGLATLAERALFAIGRGLSAVEIAALVGARDRLGELRVVLERDRRFVRVSADVYELTEWGGATAPVSPAPPAAPPPADSGIDGRRWLRVPVDAGVLRGGTVPISGGLLDVVSVAPDHRRTFASRYGPVTIMDEGQSPGLGPLRHVALACGAEPGDELWLGFGPAGDVSVRRRDGDQPRPVTGERVVPDMSPVSLTAQGAS